MLHSAGHDPDAQASWQVPVTHEEFASQTFPQAPQLAASVCTLVRLIGTRVVVTPLATITGDEVTV
jgi:hypothetical protein